MQEFIISDILWETDGEVVANLPESIILRASLDTTEDDIADILSDRYGFCVKSYYVVSNE